MLLGRSLVNCLRRSDDILRIVEGKVVYMEFGNSRIPFLESVVVIVKQFLVE
jgi:hypothetical protein